MLNALIALGIFGTILVFLEGCRAWQSSPVIGHGPRSFDFITGHKMGSHNLYGQVLCEMGLLGALALAAFVICFDPKVPPISR